MALPFAAGLSDNISDALDLDSLFMRITYVANLMFAIASLIYDIMCPYFIKHYESPAALYTEALKTKALSLSIYPNDRLDASVDTVKANYTYDNQSHPLPRLFCALSFLLGVVLFAAAFLERSLTYLYNG